MQTPKQKTAELVRRLKEFAGDNLESVILYGSAARADYQPSHSDVNVLCILKSVDTLELARIAPAVTWWCNDQHEPPPLFFRLDELRESADVFAIEILDMQESHRVLYGKDPIADIKVPMNLHRVQVEHELRTMLVRLRRHFLRAAANERELKEVCARSASSLRVLMRHVLIALGEQPSPNLHELLARVSQLTGADSGALETAGAWRSEAPADNTARRCGNYMQAIACVIQALEKRAPKREWQRIRQHDS
jgi:predicted nucleotidyltransferase